VEAGKPRTAHLLPKDIFQQVTGEVRIRDLYYGTGSLLRIDSLSHCSPIKFLTQTPDKREAQILPRAFQEWKGEHGNVEFRRHSGTDLHDRFVLADQLLILLGHGLKDPGDKKESFVILISPEFAADLMDRVRHSFDDKWRSALPIC